MTKTQKLWNLLIFLCIVLSLFLYHYLAARHFQVSFGFTLEDSICNVNATFNCDDVNTSRYSKFLGIPLSLWGFSTNLSLLFLGMTSLLSKKRQNFFHYAFYLGVFSVLASITMGFIALTQMTQFCLFCIALYILSFLILIGIWIAFGHPKFQDVLPDFKNLFSSAKLALAFLILIPITAYGLNSKMENHYQKKLEELREQSRFSQESAEQDFLKMIIETWVEGKSFDFQTESGLVYGAPADQAKMTIVEFADFLCGHCRQASESIKTFVDSKTDVRWIFMLYPLDGECNPYVQRKHGLPCQLAKTALCFADQKNAWNAHEWMFQKQKDFFAEKNPEDLIKTMVKTFGFSEKTLSTCTESEQTTQKLLKQIEQAKQNNIDGTPAIFVNGKLLPKGQSPMMLEMVYQKL